MNHFEDPFQFKIVKNIGNIKVEYINLMEVVQGGPEIGNLSINGNQLQGYYGGPLLYHEDFIYIPSYRNNFFQSGFKLVKINIKTFNIKVLSKKKDLIFLYKIKDNQLYYYEDVEKTILKHCNL